MADTADTTRPHVWIEDPSDEYRSYCLMCRAQVSPYRWKSTFECPDYDQIKVDEYFRRTARAEQDAIRAVVEEAPFDRAKILDRHTKELAEFDAKIEVAKGKLK